MAERLCPDCGVPLNGQLQCDSERCHYKADDPHAPDPWDLAEHPERYDAEAARRRSRTKRHVDPKDEWR